MAEEELLKMPIGVCAKLLELLEIQLANRL
jgi:hypothetical protein